jgi:DNA-binding transcriptional MocR family regulator
MGRTNHSGIGMRLPAELSGALEGWRLGEGPLQRRLAAALAAAVERGDLLPGTKLPPERALAAQLGVARTTVSAAYELLGRKGLVDRLQGRGTHVAGGDGMPMGRRAADLTTSLQRNVIFRRLTEGSSDAIDLLGSSAPPGAEVRQAVAAATGAIGLDQLMSDHGYYPLGYPPLRRAVAAHLSARGLPTTQEQVLVTGGAQQAISLLAAYYVSPGSVIVLEDPTFPGAVDAFRAAGARILSVPLHAAGADIGLLASTISQNTVRALFLMPTFHNPTGAVMPDAARRQLARLGRVSQTPIIDDNTLAELALGAEPPPPLAAYDRDAPIVSVGSLSKLFWAGLRVGWIRASRPVIAQLGQLKAVADLGCSLVSQAIAVGLLADVERIGDMRRAELTERLALLEGLLHDMLPDWRWRQPKGGLSIWARLPAGSSAELAQVAGRRGVLVAPGPLMSPTGGFDEFIRLPFDHDPAVLSEGVRRLASAWQVYAAALNSYGSSRMDVIV